MKEQCLKQALLPALIVMLHLHAFFHLPYANITVCLAVLGLVIWKRLWTLFHTALLFGMLSAAPLLFLFFDAASSPPVLYLMVFLSVGTVFIISPARKSLSWLRFGRLDAISRLLVLLTSLFSAAALIVWAAFSENLGAGFMMAQPLRQSPKALVFLFGVPLFALLNALAEELMFRGALQSALMSVFRPFSVLVLQAAAFAAIHFAAGFPNGVSGYLMVLLYGIMLGYLRQRSKGMLAPYLTHVAADLVIGWYLCVQVFRLDS